MSLLRDLIVDEDSGLLVARLDDHLRDLPADERPGWHPSELSRGFCPRQLVLLELGLIRRKVRIDPRLRRIFDNGHGFHHRIQGYVRDMGIVVRHPDIGDPDLDYLCEELKLRHPCGMTGRADNLLKILRVLYLTDYKSTNDRMFSNLLKPLDSHVRQVWLYLGMFSQTMPEDLTAYPLKGLIVYENKNDQTLKEFPVAWGSSGKEYFDSTVQQLEEMNAAIAEETPGAVPCTCGKCPTRKDLGLS